MKHAKWGVSMAALVVMGGLSTVAALAQNTPTDAPPRIERKVIVEIRNKDGVITKEDARGPLKDHFDEIDTNKDGKLNEDEIIAFHEKHGPPEWMPRECRMIIIKDDKGAKEVKKDADRPPRRDFSIFVGDKDGKISRDEFLKRQGEIFDRLDANKDGFLTPEERPGPRMGPGCPPPADMPPPPGEAPPPPPPR